MSSDRSRAAGMRVTTKGRSERVLPAWPARVLGALAGAFGTVAGLTPHVLHHIGPIAGAALLTGTEGSVLFGIIGFGLTIPLLLRLKRRFSTWVAPGVALAFFAVMFTISTIWVGPVIRGDDGGSEASPTEDPHHSSKSSTGSTVVEFTVTDRDDVWLLLGEKAETRHGAMLAPQEELPDSLPRRLR